MSCGLQVVIDDVNSAQDIPHEGLPFQPATVIRQFHPNEQLRCRHRRNRNVVVAAEKSVDLLGRALGLDEHRGV